MTLTIDDRRTVLEAVADVCLLCEEQPATVSGAVCSACFEHRVVIEADGCWTTTEEEER